MNRALKVILPLLTASLIASIILLSFFGGKREDGRIECRHLRITVTDSLENNFATADNIAGWLNAEFGDLTGQNLSSLDIGAVESALSAHPAVEDVEVFVTRDSCLNIILTQKHPFARLEGRDGGFYIDRRGNMFPLLDGGSADITLIEGDIPVKFDASRGGRAGSAGEQEWLDKVIRLVEYVGSHPEWQKVIGKILVDGKSDIILVPISGKEKFIFGQASGIEDKFERIKAYYTNILPARGEYASVNVKFGKQIVCRK